MRVKKRWKTKEMRYSFNRFLSVFICNNGILSNKNIISGLEHLINYLTSVDL